MEENNNISLKEVLTKIESYSKRKILLNIFNRFLKIFIFVILLFAFLVLLESIFNFTSNIRTFLFFTFIAIVFSFFAAAITPLVIKYFKPLTNNNNYNLSNEIGNQFQGIKDELTNSLQLLNADNKNTSYSPALIESSFSLTYNKIKNINFNEKLNLNKYKKLVRFTLSVFIICFSLFNIFPLLSNASNRLLKYNTDFTPPPSFNLKILPGNIQITKGEDINIKIIGKGDVPNEIFLATKTIEQTDYQLLPLKVDSLNQFNYNLKAVNNSFEYYAAANNISSQKYRIEVINRPIVKNFTLTISPPAYSKLPSTIQKDNGNIFALKGSRVKINLISTKDIQKAYIDFNSNKKINLSSNFDKADGVFYINKDDNYKILLTDKSDITNASPILYEIKVLEDEYPKIDLMSPQNDVSLSIDNRIPISLKISDDYGFSQLKLFYKKSNSSSVEDSLSLKSINIPLDKGKNNLEVNYIWNITDLNLTSNEVLSFYAEVFDNDIISGPKSSKSKNINVRVPSLDELLTKTDNTYKNSIDDLKNTLKKAEEIHKNLKDIAQNLKKDKKDIEWKEKTKIEEENKKLKELQKNASKVTEELKKMKEYLQKNNLLSSETMEKYMELQKLMDTFSTEEMKKAMEQMQNLLSTLDRQKIQDALKNIQFNEEQFKSSLERTLNLLKRIKVSQKIDELLARTKDIEKKENEINKNTKEGNPSKNNQISDKQKDVTNSIDNLKKELENLEKLMNELSDMPKESLDSLKNEFSKQKNKELSDKISKNLTENKKQDALQLQQQLANNMKKMQNMVSQLKKEMEQKNQTETFVQMMKSLDDLISLSKKEEALKELINNPNNISAFKENAEKQNELLRNLNRVMQQLNKLSQKTFAITPEMGKALGDAGRSMMESIDALQNRSGYLSLNKQNNAMGSLNDASSLLKSSLESMMKGGGQGGMMSLMQQLGQMAQQQMNLNNLTKGFQQNRKFSQQQLAELQRLKQQHDLIRKSLQQLNEEAKTTGKSKSLAADMEDILNKMQEVITNMNNTKIDDDVIQTQERILSKLLDAQRSVNERDFDKNRKSYTGKDILKQSPANFALDDEKKNALREELMKAISEGYNKDYEELIKKYFEELEKKSTIK